MKLLNHLKIMNNYKKNNLILPPPVFMWVEPTNYCNLKCIMCSNSVINEERGYLKFSLYKKIIDEIKYYVGGIFLFHAGESLFHKDIIRMINYAENNGVKIQLHTNATILDKKMRRRLIKSRLSYILFSFDGLTKENYERIRINANFETTMNNVRGFLNENDNIYTVIQNIIIDSIMDKDIFKSDFINFYDMFETLPKDIIIKYPIDMADEKLKGRYTTFNPKKENVKCPMVWGSSVIRWNGDVVACPFDFTGDIKLGNMTNDSFIDIWNGHNYQMLRKGVIPNKCMDCVCTRKGTFMGLSIELWKILSFYLINKMGYSWEGIFSSLITNESSQYKIIRGKDYNKVDDVWIE